MIGFKIIMITSQTARPYRKLLDFVLQLLPRLSVRFLGGNLTMAMDFAQMEQIAKQFTDFYYQTFDTNRAALQNLYVCGIHHCLICIPQILSAPVARLFHADL